MSAKPRRVVSPRLRQALARPARATFWLVMSLALVFALQLKVDALQSVLGMIRMGANVPALVAAGEWWRLVSANFLHGSVLHIAFNGWALWVLGGLLERMLDGRRLLLLYLASALGGAAASTVFSGALLAVGASTAVFGLLGGLAAIQWRLGPKLPELFRQPRRWWWLVLGVNAAIPLLVPNIDGAAHLGGFATGGLVGLTLVGPGRPLMAPSAHPAVLAALGVVVLVCGVGLGAAVIGAQGFDEAAEARVLRAVAAHQDTPPDVINDLAWGVAIDPQAGRVRLEAAAAAAQVAVERGEEKPDHLLDTLATLKARLGDGPGAAAAELTALALAPRAFYATQLGRFLEGTRRPAWLDGGLTAAPGGQRVTLSGGRPDRSQVVVARIQRARAPAGIWVARVEAGSAGELRRDLRSAALPEGIHFELLGALELPAAAPKDFLESGRWRWWPDDPEALALRLTRAD